MNIQKYGTCMPLNGTEPVNFSQTGISLEPVVLEPYLPDNQCLRPGVNPIHYGLNYAPFEQKIINTLCVPKIINTPFNSVKSVIVADGCTMPPDICFPDGRNLVDDKICLIGGEGVFRKIAPKIVPETPQTPS